MTYSKFVEFWSNLLVNNEASCLNFLLFMNLELFINKQQNKLFGDLLKIINIVAKGQIGMSFMLLYYWKQRHVCRFSTFLKTNIFRGFLTSEKVIFVKSIFDMFLTPIAYANKHNYLKPHKWWNVVPSTNMEDFELLA